MNLRVSHLTRYCYDKAVGFTPHVLYLRPRESPRVRLEDYRLAVEPAAMIVQARDTQDNDMAMVHVWERADALVIDSSFSVRTLDANPFDFLLAARAIPFPFRYDPVERAALAPYLASPAPATAAALRDWLGSHLSSPPAETVPWLTAVARVIFETIAYARREEEGIQTSLETMTRLSGACRDTAAFACELLRTLGLATRFVSGYLYAPPEDDHRSREAMHAWMETYLPGAGWKAIDPTHGVFCDDCYIPVAHSAAAESVNPIQGGIANDEPATATMEAALLIERLA